MKPQTIADACSGQGAIAQSCSVQSHTCDLDEVHSAAVVDALSRYVVVPW